METLNQPFVAQPKKASFFSRNKRSLIITGIAVSAVVAVVACSVVLAANGSSAEARASKYFVDHSISEPPTGEYWRPPAEDTTGKPGVNKAFKRSPCPALNTLANHGFLPRNGEDLTINMLGNALLEHYNLDWKLGAALAVAARVAIKLLPWQSMSLADLSTHNAIEHDASLFHYDAETKHDPSEMSIDYLNQLISLAGANTTVGLDNIIAFRRARIASCRSSNPDFSLDSTHTTIANGEAALLLDVLGRDQSIPFDQLKSFVVDEKIPDGWVKAPEVMTKSKVQPTIDAIAQGLQPQSTQHQ